MYLTEEVERLKAKTDTVDKLEEENQALRNELCQLQDAATSPTNTIKLEEENRLLKQQILQLKATPAPIGLGLRASLGTEDDQDPLSAQDRLPAARKPLEELSPNKITRACTPGIGDETLNDNDYDKLAARYSKAVAALEKTQAVARRYLQDKNKWMAYAESLERKVEKLRQVASVPGKPTVSDYVASVVPSPSEPAMAAAAAAAAFEHIDAASLARRSPTNVSFISNPDPDHPVGVLDTAPEPGSAFKRAASTPAAPTTGMAEPATQSTDSDPEEPREHDLELLHYHAGMMHSPWCPSSRSHHRIHLWLCLSGVFANASMDLPSQPSRFAGSSLRVVVMPRNQPSQARQSSSPPMRAWISMQALEYGPLKGATSH